MTHDWGIQIIRSCFYRGITQVAASMDWGKSWKTSLMTTSDFDRDSKRNLSWIQILERYTNLLAFTNLVCLRPWIWLLWFIYLISIFFIKFQALSQLRCFSVWIVQFYFPTCEAWLPLKYSSPTTMLYIVSRNKFHFSDESYRHACGQSHNSQTIKIGIYFNVRRSTRLFFRWCDEVFLFLFYSRALVFKSLLVQEHPEIP